MIFLELSGWQKAIRGLSALLCDVIYTLISKIYELFITVARLDILSSDQIGPIYQRVTMILTIVMTFYITFEFVKYTIQPDNFTDKEKGVGNILQRIVIVVALIAFMPNVFKLAYDLQSRIIETQLISKMILGTTDHDYASYGNEFSANMLNLFYYYDKDVCAGGGGDCSEAEATVTENLEHLRETGDSDIVTGINAESTKSIFKEKYPAIKFNTILAPVVGGIVLYILALYCIDVGVRYAQLIFLQLMSPIAIMGYLLPKKDGIFQKWGKQCISTYIDLFIRIIIINFVLLIITVLGDAFNTGNIFASIGEVSNSLKIFTYIVLVLGLLIFAQRAPKLLGELLPSSGAAGIGMGLGTKDRIEAAKKSLGVAKAPFSVGRRVVGGVGGLVAGGIAGKSLKGALSGAKAGFDNKNNKGLLGGSLFSRVKNAAFAGGAVRQQREDIKDNGGSVFAAEHMAGHYKNVAQAQDRLVSGYEAVPKYKDAVGSSVKEIKALKQLEAMKAAASASGDDALALRLETQIKKVEKAARVYATDTSNATNKASLEKAIREAAKGTAIETNLNSDPKYMEDILETNSAKWNTVTTNIGEARRIAFGTVGEQTIKVTRKDASGNDVDVDVKINNLSDEEFAQKIGDIADLAKSLAEQEKAKPEYRAAHANAKGAGGNS